MLCSKCGNPIQEGTKFCTRCGNQIVSEQQNTNIQQPINNMEQQINIGISQTSPQNNIVQPNPNVQQVQQVYTQNIQKTGNSMLKTILMGLIKPISNFRNNETELTSVSNSAILTGMISVMIMIINLIVTVITTLFTKSTQTCFMGYCYGEELSFADKLKSIDWWPLIWQYIVIPAVIMLLIAGVYYIVSLIFKKKVDFGKLLGMTSLSLVPTFITFVLISPLLGLVWTPLSIIVSAASFMYSITILTVLLYNELKFENDDQYLFFNLVSVVIIVSIAILVVNMMLQQTLGSLTSLF